MLELFSPNFWWILAGIFLVMEIMTPSTILIFPSIAAAITALFAYVFDYFVVQIIIFILLTTFLLIMIKPMMKSLHKGREQMKFGRDALLESIVYVIEEIDNSKNKGRVKHAGDIFPAVSVDNSIIPENTKVIVKSIDGIKLLVKECNHESKESKNID